MLLAQLSDLFSTHWSVVLLIAVPFFILQISLCVRFFARMRRQQKTLQALHQHLQKDGDGRENIETLSRHFPWLKWVDEVFPAGTKTPGNYTRDDVLQELDTRIASSSDYLLLQRLGVMAPLLGVILTVLGFAWLDPQEAESLKAILSAVTPLVAGVCAGAVLAFINQGLLHVTGNQAESLRMTARNWFDSAIWSGVGLDTQAATVKAIHAIERMAQSVAESVDHHAESTDRLVKTTASIQKAGDALHESVAAFGGELAGLPESLAGLHEATVATAESLQQLIPVGQRAVAGLDVSVSAFRTAIENDFIEAATLHRTALDGIHESVGRIAESTDNLQAGSAGLRETVDNQGKSYETLNESLRGRVLPAHEALQGTVGGLSDEMRDFRSVVETLSANVESVAAEFAQVAGQMKPAVGAFRNAIDDQFATATRRHEQNLEWLADSVARINEGAHTLAEGAVEVRKLLDGQAELSSRMAPAQDALQGAVERIAAVGETLKQSFDGDVAPSNRAMHEATDSFADSANRLSGFVENLAPAAKRLAELDQTLSRLDETVQSIRDFSSMRRDVDQLTESLAQAATVADAISELPARIREILEELVASQQGGNSRGPLLNWLRGAQEAKQP